MEGGLYKYPMKNILNIKGIAMKTNILFFFMDGKVLDHLGFRSKVLPGSLTDLSAWVGFCTSSPQQGVKY